MHSYHLSDFNTYMKIKYNYFSTKDHVTVYFTGTNLQKQNSRLEFKFDFKKLYQNSN